MSQITTHILDTSKGKPAKGVKICLEKELSNNNWSEIAKGITNDDGRLPSLLADDVTLDFGAYRLVFDTETYFKSLNVVTLYPSVTITFNVTDKTHYHIPLLLNPFGYSTYRGS